MEFVAYYPPVRLLCDPDQHLCFDPVLEAGYSDHSSQDDDETINVGCGYVLILHGIVLLAAGLFLTYLVSSSQGRFRC